MRIQLSALGILAKLLCHRARSLAHIYPSLGLSEGKNLMFTVPLLLAVLAMSQKYINVEDCTLTVSQLNVEESLAFQVLLYTFFFITNSKPQLCK